MQTKIILIRHGETKANLERRYIGATESPLTDYGKKQAKNLRKRMIKEGVQKVFSSSSERALNFSRIAFSNSNIGVLPELCEMNFGVFEGLTYSQIFKKYPDIYNRWLKNPVAYSIPKAESFNEFKTRILKVFKKIISANYGKTVAIIAHAGPIRLILSKILNSKNIWETSPALASISIIEFDQNKPKVLVFNETTYYE